MLTKYEPVGTHDDPVYNSFCVSVGDPVGLKPVKKISFLLTIRGGSRPDYVEPQATVPECMLERRAMSKGC